MEELLNVSRIEQGRLPVAVQPTELEPIISDIVSQIKVNADEKGLVLEYLEESNKLPLVLADPERLRQVLINLIGNSIKYTGKGSVKITAAVKNNLVEIKVVDTGFGIFKNFIACRMKKPAKSSAPVWDFGLPNKLLN